jgi:CHASE1-domain containing sensor protein
MFTPTRITRSIAIAFGALAAATASVTVASAMPADPVTPGPAVVSTPGSVSGSDAAQIEAPAAADRGDAAQRSPVEPPAVVGGRAVGVHNTPQASPDSDIKWTVAIVLALLVLLASIAALTTRPQRHTAT